MTENMINKNDTLFECPICGLHYEDEAIAKKCEAFCRQFKSCNLDLTKFSVESKNKD